MACYRDSFTFTLHVLPPVQPAVLSDVINTENNYQLAAEDV
jgi:hypothetical protein